MDTGNLQWELGIGHHLRFLHRGHLFREGERSRVGAPRNDNRRGGHGLVHRRSRNGGCDRIRSFPLQHKLLEYLNGKCLWTWVPLQRSSTQSECQVDEGNILGVSSPPWTPSTATGAVAYVWGAYSYLKTPATHIGGACTITAAGADSQLVGPDTYRMTIRDVAPSGSTADWLFVAGAVEVTTQLELWKHTTGLAGDPAYPLLVDVSGTTPVVTELTTTPPNLVGLSAGWGADTTTGDPLLLFGTEGSGAWRGFLTW